MQSDPQKVTVPCEDGWEGHIEIDGRWFNEWVEYGIGQLERWLTRTAQFDRWCAKTGRS